MKLKLIAKQPVVPGVTSFIFEPSLPLAWKPGQFLHYALHHEPTDDRGSDRWFTISSAPSEGHVMISTRIASERGSSFKNALDSLPVGKSIGIIDMEGDGDFTVDDPSRDLLFIAGGIGITPFRSILTEADHAGTALSVTLLYANRDEAVPFREELDAIATRNPKLHIRYFIGDQIDEAAIREAAASLTDPIYYVSGPEPMVESFGIVLQGMGVTPANIKQDWFPGYPAE